MVSTRGGTRTSGGTTANMLAKKPLRRMAVKDPPAQTAATKAKAKTKTMRAKKTELEVEVPDEDFDELQDDSEVAVVRSVSRRTQPSTKQDDVPKPAKRSTTRVRRDEEPGKEAPATKSTAKVGRPKGSKNKPKAESTDEGKQKPELPPPVVSKATRATRATASTTAKGRAPPLSPKKVTQVTKVAPKPTRGATAKSTTAKANVSKPASRGRPATTRRRNVSDENVEPEARPSAEQQHEQDPEVPADQPGKTTRLLSARMPMRATEESAEESRAAMQRRHTAKADQEDLDDSEEEKDELSLGSLGHAEDSDVGAPSGDELLGPKTPLKRCNPPDVAKFASIKMSPTRVEYPIKTPVRRFMVLGTQQGTPQTQKPYCKPSIPVSEVRPTTVARAHDRAMVFSKLQPLSRPKENEDVEGWEQSDTPDDRDGDEAMAEDETEHAADRQHPFTGEDDISDMPLGDVREDVSGTQESMSILTEDDNEPHDSISDDDVLHEERGDDGYPWHVSHSSNAAERIEAVVEARCPEDLTTWSLDDRFNRDYHETQSEGESLAAETLPNDVEMADATPRPETLQWQNIREDVTIPFNFDANIATSRGLPQIESTESLEVTAGLSLTDGKPEIQASPQQDAMLTEGSDKAVAAEPDVEETDGKGIAINGEDATVRRSSLRLSELIDVDSLAQSIGACEEQAMPRAETAIEGVPVSNMDCSPSPSKASTTAARDVPETDIALDDAQDEGIDEVPRYARATISSRRKSLPAIFQRTPSQHAERPPASHGLSLPRVEIPYGNYLFTNSKTPFKATPARPRTSMPHGLASERKLRKASQTPITGSPVAKTPGTSVPSHFHIDKDENALSSPKTPISRMLFARTPGTSVPDSVDPTAAERFPGMPHNSYGLDDTADSRRAVSYKSPERFPGLPASNSYEELVSNSNITAAGMTTSATAESTQKDSAVKERFPGLPARNAYIIEPAVVRENITPQPPATPTGERYPGLPAKRSYEEHAKTAVPPSRFRTPTRSPAKPNRRPATLQKPASLRRAALKASATPIKTPLKASAMTPGTVPMTPHPAAPLRGVVALVEVYTTDGGCATPAFIVLLQRLGAKTTKTFSERVTHLVFKEGSPTTLQRLRVHNKQVTETGVGHEIHCVNSRWVSDCDTQGSRMDEADEAYAVDVEDVPRAGKRRRKSMEPTSLLNIDGNVVRDRKSSLGRGSLSRTPKKFDTPSEIGITPKITAIEKENSENGGDASPATPAYLAAPSSLVQQTAPMNRMRKLDFKDGKEPKSRRLTFFGGGEF